MWVIDRLAGRAAGFVTRRHANLTVRANGDWGPEAETGAGRVGERAATVTRAGRDVRAVRQVRVVLAQPTRDGDREVRILTNPPVEVADAAAVADLYRRRWTIEGVFLDLARDLNCEAKTRCDPTAALSAFCVGLVAYAVSAVVKAGRRAAHGVEKVEAEVSGYDLAWELGAVYLGMMAVIPAAEWACVRRMTTADLGTVLQELAGQVDLGRYRKPPRKPKKPPAKRVGRKDQPHVSTARLLEGRKASQRTREA